MTNEETNELASQLKDKLRAETEIRNQRIKILQSLDTKSLLEKIPKLEDDFEAAMRDEASFRNLNLGYLASQGNDCAEVKRLLAQEMAQAIGRNQTEREAWLIRQRTANSEISNAISRQEDVAFQLEQKRITVEMAKKRLESVKVVLALKTAQIEYLRV